VKHKGRSLGRLRSWVLFVVWIAWIIGWALLGAFGAITETVAIVLVLLWVRSLIDPESWSRGNFRRDNLAQRSGRAQTRAARRARRLAATKGLPQRVPSSTQRARAAARRERHRARDIG
jgi:hypothetical protein